VGDALCPYRYDVLCMLVSVLVPGSAGWPLKVAGCKQLSMQTRQHIRYICAAKSNTLACDVHARSDLCSSHMAYVMEPAQHWHHVTPIRTSNLGLICNSFLTRRPSSQPWSSVCMYQSLSDPADPGNMPNWCSNGCQPHAVCSHLGTMVSAMNRKSYRPT
jgi:hypothetical protein